MLFKSVGTVSREFYLEKRVYVGLTSLWLTQGYIEGVLDTPGLAEGAAKTLCCAKTCHVFMLFTIIL